MTRPQTRKYMQLLHLLRVTQNNHIATLGTERDWEVWSPFWTADAQIKFGSSVTNGGRKWILKEHWEDEMAALSHQESILWALRAGEFLSTLPFSYSEKLFSSALATESRSWTCFYLLLYPFHISWALNTNRWWEHCHKRKENRNSEKKLQVCHSSYH